MTHCEGIALGIGSRNKARAAIRFVLSVCWVDVAGTNGRYCVEGKYH